MDRKINFSAGPSGLPLSVLEHAQKELTSYQSKGYSIMEISHRSKVFEEIHFGAMDKIKRLYGINDDYEILFLQGGASLQFAMIPMNLCKGGKAEYVDTGVWTSKAIKEAKIQGINYEVIASSKDTNFDRIPENINFSDDADYAYICTNNTIYGTQYKSLPNTKAPLVIDASSDFFSYKMDFSNIGVLYGGAQKNAGPSGVTVVIIRKDLLDRAGENVPTMLKYKTHTDAKSLFNTPPTFGIYLLNLTLGWIESQGGLDVIKGINEQKASILYEAIDNSGGFYKGHSIKKYRSIMNVSYNIAANSELEPLFVAEAEKAGMIGLKGHRHLGGIRASIYNAVSLENVKTLVSFMGEFAKKFG
ncbi:phosphoserine transaminase [Campylobacter sp. CCUG 57310]|uniref:phosphoserine transaminase n=1 Tax=Campylobacter sp. CCUG 57310 TaxID=2517362 RepID=UPI0015647EB5|nr:phosphoserine transaminase [Campylobacter sp. CCUG 57310]QKF92868.1 phosphohydroxythreonine aminotransferase / 3-phosphoserine aminotransferase [Campylobacter sp. CCUG 57310]